MPQCGGEPVKQLGIFPTFAPCLEHICAGGGGSVANMGLILICRGGGDFISCLEIMFTCRNVMGGRAIITMYEVMCDVRHRAKRRASDWRREGK